MTYLSNFLIRLWKKVDFFLIAIFLVMIVGIFIRLPDQQLHLLEDLSSFMVMLLFFTYGAKLPFQEIRQGITNWKLHISVLVATFLIFPLLGLILYPVNLYFLGASFALGCLYVTLLPSTVQSSIAFTSIAKGNVAGAVCAATLSNTLGVFLTPLLVYLCMGKESGVDLHNFYGVLTHLLLPFFIGQLVQPVIGKWLRAHRLVTKVVDNSSVLLVVASAVGIASSRGLWQRSGVWEIFGLVGSSAVLLFLLLAWTWVSGRGLSRADRIVLLMCGSKKSLASGIPMAAIIFPSAVLASVTIPVIIFHQFQLIVCSVIARRLGQVEA